MPIPAAKMGNSLIAMVLRNIGAYPATKLNQEHQICIETYRNIYIHMFI